MLRLSLAAALLACVAAPASHAQTGETASTAQTQAATELAARDAALFDAAFERCNAAAVRTFLTDDFEFYDDREGMPADSGDSFAADVARGCASRAAGDNQDLRRTLVAGTLTTELLGDYGAMQTGRHNFSEVMADGSVELRGTALFLHLWRRTADGWLLAREISHAHAPLEAD